MRANTETRQYKIQFNYKTKSSAKTIHQSQGLARKGFCGRKDMCWSYRQDSKTHSDKMEEGGIYSELALSSGRVISI